MPRWCSGKDSLQPKPWFPDHVSADYTACADQLVKATQGFGNPRILFASREFDAHQRSSLLSFLAEELPGEGEFEVEVNVNVTYVDYDAQAL